jgi:hypothetical protein
MQGEMGMRVLISALLAVAAVVVCQPAFAQRSAGSKILGTAYDYPYFYRSAGAYQESAYQHADLLRESVSYGEPVPQAIAREHTAAIRQNVQAADKKYAAIRKLAGDHKQVKQHLDAIDAHHKAVLGHADKIDAHVASGTGDAAAVEASSHAAAESLKSAQAEHEKLMQYFGKPQPKPATK